MKEGAGKAEEAWGHATHDAETEAEGEGKQAEGKIQEGWGHAKDDVRDAVHDATHNDEDRN